MAEAVIADSAARAALRPEIQAAFGQFFTPIRVAELMASMVPVHRGHVRVLDPGAGAGVLSTTYGAHRLASATPGDRLSITAFEIDPALLPYLEQVRAALTKAWAGRGLQAELDVRLEDYADVASRAGMGDLFTGTPDYDVAILNPPYRKLGADSVLRSRLDALGIHAPNLYAAFLGLAVNQVREGGSIVAIVPRSFCNGTYFRDFRRFLFGRCSLREIHLFRQRDEAFEQDSILQENVILSLTRGIQQAGSVRLSFSEGTADGTVWYRDVPQQHVVRPGDHDLFLHLPEDEWSEKLADTCRSLPATLQSLDIEVSTGPVVDFRLREFIGHIERDETDVPLLYPANFRDLIGRWPIQGKKPQYISVNERTAGWLVPNGWYVVTRRFSSKEEKRRVVASVVDPRRLGTDRLGIENHLNYFHSGGQPLDQVLAMGLAAFLNSTLVDEYFRQFSGHTQVNAGDLRKLRYPSRESLINVGSQLTAPPIGSEADDLLRKHCPELEDMPGSNHARAKISQAIDVLAQLGLPRDQLNERSGLTLLALLGLKPQDSWTAASAPMIGVTPIMEWADRYYDRKYAPNSRETFRRFTLHQFVDAALVVPNPDKPARAVNSPKFCYQVEPTALDLLRTYGSPEWPAALAVYAEQRVGLREKYAQKRVMEMIPLVLGKGIEITLTPGGQNELVSEVITQFCPRFVPGGQPVYVGDTGDKWAYFDTTLANQLGIQVDLHGKMPDLVILDRERGWLILIEAVTSHGPVNPKRLKELKGLLATAKIGLVFVTAFLDRSTLTKYLAEIAWETEVWVAESPDHMIHFDGERFLGPYTGQTEPRG
ncbi:MAG: BsuBI/PstI family type II restriction endonuclease [Gemmatimonadales bacterium]